MSLLDGLKRRRQADKAEISSEPVSFMPIGVVRSKWRDMDKPGGTSAAAEIVLRDDLAEALDSIEGFSHLMVIFHLHRVPPEEGRATVPVSGRVRGVLATRSQRRPNPLGVCAVELVGRDGNSLRVNGLDAIDGTPVLDIKPYLPPYDSIPEAKIPGWASGAE